MFVSQMALVSSSGRMLLHGGRLIQKIRSSEELLIAYLGTVLHRVYSITFSQELWLLGEYHTGASVFLPPNLTNLC